MTFQLETEVGRWSTDYVFMAIRIASRVRTVGQCKGLLPGLTKNGCLEQTQAQTQKLETLYHFADSCKDLVKDVQDATDGLGPDAALIATGDITPFNQATMYLRLKGTLVCVGVLAGNAVLNIPVSLLVTKVKYISFRTLCN